MAISSYIEDTFAQVIQTNLFQKSQIDISVHILQADGGVLAACINATTLALVHAGIPMVDFVTSCSVGFLDHTVLLDLNHAEETAGGPELSITLLPKSSKILTLKMAGSSTRVNETLLAQLLQEATLGCQRVHKALDTKVRELVAETLARQHGEEEAI